MKEFKLTGRLFENKIIPGNGYSNILENIQLFTQSSAPRVELVIRVRDLRQDWIDEWYAAAKVAEQSGEIFVKFCKDATFVCAYGTASHQDIACAAPRHGDKYDQRTGIAVAYAKFCDAEIPDCI